jgi:glutaredoxin-like YruB-family protein
MGTVVAGKAAGAQQRQPEVIIYSTPTCPYCSSAKAYFVDKGIRFTDYDVSRDQARAREMIMKTQQEGVPVIQIDGRLIIGFDRKLIEEALKMAPLLKREDVIGNLLYDPFNI